MIISIIFLTISRSIFRKTVEMSTKHSQINSILLTDFTLCVSRYNIYAKLSPTLIYYFKFELKC